MEVGYEEAAFRIHHIYLVLCHIFKRMGVFHEHISLPYPLGQFRPVVYDGTFGSRPVTSQIEADGVPCS